MSNQGDGRLTITPPNDAGGPVEGQAGGPDAPRENASRRRKNHRAGRKKRNRRQSFAVPANQDNIAIPQDPDHLIVPEATARRMSFYRLGQPSSGRANLSTLSLESEALLDHRDRQASLLHRPSTYEQSSFVSRPALSSKGKSFEAPPTYRSSYENPLAPIENSHFQQQSPRSARAHHRQYANYSDTNNEDGDEPIANDRTPLISSSIQNGQEKKGSRAGLGYTLKRQNSAATSSSSRNRRPGLTGGGGGVGYGINFPPSVPGSPDAMGRNMSFEDMMIHEHFGTSNTCEPYRPPGSGGQDTLLQINGDIISGSPINSHSPPPSRKELYEQRRHSTIPSAEEDVCFPTDAASEIADEDMPQLSGKPYQNGPRRRRVREWPDLQVLEDWSREEREVRSEGIRAKKMREPELVGGRLRPMGNKGWHREEEEAPYRFTYFNEDLQSTIHSQTISELLQLGQTFRDLFIPSPPELSESDTSDDEDLISLNDQQPFQSGINELRPSHQQSTTAEEQQSHSRRPSLPQKEKHKRYGPRPTFWLDVLSPTEAEMRVISKAFGIHPLTAEDIMMQEAREKVELFRNYYLVNYRTFEQDMNNEDFLEPVNMYVVVFRECVVSFHFSMTPHPANVRRRIRQLKDYLILSSDWISYAIIDDITDVFFPLIQSIEEEVDDIDDAILQMHSPTPPESSKSLNEKPLSSEDGFISSGERGGDMLRRVGTCRKKVMGLYRLLGNKADVIKGFAKRCNEQWEVAPRSEIGLYLGDIQDHIVTMTSNLSHYEKILSRSHSNYLAQINIRMNERQEMTADVLGRLTVLGTIVLPMNIITGLWGMNVLVPGQDVGSLYWFWGITAGLFAFGFLCFSVAKRVYGIV
ncbi:MAG: CorA metal ion transporter [Trizodia sp. TS-e1964]|nr:MAG: CorA metal ion transporter [Trizodia sp. TS-e1964]